MSASTREFLTILATILLIAIGICLFLDLVHWIWRARLEKNGAYFCYASLGSLFSQTWVLLRHVFYLGVRDWRPDELFVSTQFLLSGLAFVLMVPVLRRGSWRQRLCAFLLCLWPVTVMCGFIWEAILTPR